MTDMLRIEDSGGVLGLTEVRLDPGEEGPVADHESADYGYYVIEGELNVTLGDQDARLSGGGFAFAPTGVPHTVVNGGDAETGLRGVVSLGGDTDTNAAVAGTLLGARDGVGGLPRSWLERLEDTDAILGEAGALVPLAEARCHRDGRRVDQVIRKGARDERLSNFAKAQVQIAGLPAHVDEDHPSGLDREHKRCRVEDGAEHGVTPVVAERRLKPRAYAGHNHRQLGANEQQSGEVDAVGHREIR